MGVVNVLLLFLVGLAPVMDVLLQFLVGRYQLVHGDVLFKVMESELKKLYETIDSIHTEMFYLREREEEMEELNQATNAKMAWLSGLSLIVCLSVAGLQLWHLKTFFEKKKII